jgi:predicted PurR-regulated permease PerM
MGAIKNAFAQKFANLLVSVLIVLVLVFGGLFIMNNYFSSRIQKMEDQTTALIQRIETKEVAFEKTISDKWDGFFAKIEKLLGELKILN